MKILMGITGGIAAYKACDVISGLKVTGHDVIVIMTDSAQKFVTPLTFATLSQNPVMTTMWSDNYEIDHIEAAKWCEVFVIVPATLNTISKFANGIADNLLSTVFAAIPKDTPKLIFPAMNKDMLLSPGMVRSTMILGKEHFGCFVYETVEKRLACGDVGKGGLMKPRDIVEQINKICETLED